MAFNRGLFIDYYKFFGIDRSASNDQIQKAYRDLITKIHPDTYPDYDKLDEKAKKALDDKVRIANNGRDLLLRNIRDIAGFASKEEYDREHALIMARQAAGKRPAPPPTPQPPQPQPRPSTPPRRPAPPPQPRTPPSGGTAPPRPRTAPPPPPAPPRSTPPFQGGTPPTPPRRPSPPPPQPRPRTQTQVPPPPFGFAWTPPPPQTQPSPTTPPQGGAGIPKPSVSQVNNLFGGRISQWAGKAASSFSKTALGKAAAGAGRAVSAAMKAVSSAIKAIAAAINVAPVVGQIIGAALIIIPALMKKGHEYAAGIFYGIPQVVASFAILLMTILTTFMVIIATPIVLSLIGMVIFTAFAIFVITAGGHVVPPGSPIYDGEGQFGEGPGGAYAMCWPTYGTIEQGPGVGPGVEGPHHATWGSSDQAIDISNRQGEPVYATHDGTAHLAGPATDYYSPLYGITVYIVGANLTTLYAHLLSTPISSPTVVKAGDLIGLMNNTGTNTSGVHLHYEVIPGSIGIDNIVPPYTEGGVTTGCFAKDSGGSDTPPPAGGGGGGGPTPSVPPVSYCYLAGGECGLPANCRADCVIPNPGSVPSWCPSPITTCCERGCAPEPVGDNCTNSGGVCSASSTSCEELTAPSGTWNCPSNLPKCCNSGGIPEG